MTVTRADATGGARWPWRRIAARPGRVVAMAAIGVVAAGSLTSCAADGSGSSSNGSSSPQATVVRNGEVWLQGEITQDGCDVSRTHLPIGDTGCSITVNGYQVDVVGGNALTRGKPGTVTGLVPSKDQAGAHATVYAQLTGPHSASVLAAPKYYARISG
jgi:hypothetical protein